MTVAFPSNLDARLAWQERQDAAERAEPVPPPSHTSRDPWPVSVTPPKGVRDLEAWAKANGWTVGVTYACGPWIGPRGISYRQSIGVRCRLGNRFALAFYVAPLEVNRWTYANSMVAGGPVGVFPYCNVTDFREYLERRGEVAEEWFGVIKDRIASAKARAKATAAARPKRASEVHA